MDLKKARKKRKKGDTAQLAARLAPLEERDKRAGSPQLESAHGTASAQADPDFGAIVVDNDDMRVRKDIMEGGYEKTFLGMEPVVLVILGVMLAFIAFIAWQISLMPAE